MHCDICLDVGRICSERGVWNRCTACRPVLKPGDLCVLGGRSTWKVGYVVGSSRATGKVRVASFSTNANSFSNPFVLKDELVLPLPPTDSRNARQRYVIRRAVLASAELRRDLRTKGQADAL